MKKNLNKVKGALYGLAVGDALGAPLEFMTREEIAARHGEVDSMIGGGWLNLAPGEVTDDTQMTLCVAKGIALASPSKTEPIAEETKEAVLVEIGDQFFEWADSGPKDIGNTCRAAIEGARTRIRFGEVNEVKAWYDSAQNYHMASGGKSGGNGSLMRTLYPALYFDNASSALGMAAAQSMMTHYDHVATHCCMDYVQLVHFALRNEYDDAKDKLNRWIYRSLDSGFLPESCPPDGYVLHSMRVATALVSGSTSFKEALVGIVNLGGDTDTNAAIAGGLAGAIWGFDAIPKKWVDALPAAVKRELDYYASLAIA